MPMHLYEFVALYKSFYYYVLFHYYLTIISQIIIIISRLRPTETFFFIICVMFSRGFTVLQFYLNSHLAWLDQYVQCRRAWWSNAMYVHIYSFDDYSQTPVKYYKSSEIDRDVIINETQWLFAIRMRVSAGFLNLLQVDYWLSIVERVSAWI